MVQEYFVAVDATVSDFNPRSIAVAIYLQEIVDPQAVDVRLSLRQFISFCAEHHLCLDEIEYGLNNKSLVGHLISWCQRQSDARYMIIRQAILDMIGTHDVTDDYLMSAFAIAMDLEGSLDFLLD